MSTPASATGGQRTFPTARDAVAELERRHGRRSALWTYHDAHGRPVGLIVRWDRPECEDIRPVAHNGDGWGIGGMPEPRPLYSLPELANTERVYVTEGEPAADAARSIGLTATTCPHGSKSADKADWSPLAGKEAILLRDNDQAGRTPEAADAASITAGVRLSRWFGHEARRVYAMLDESDEARERRRLVELIRRKGGSVTPRDLMR